jgi:hypothetical protein
MEEYFQERDPQNVRRYFYHDNVRTMTNSLNTNLNWQRQIIPFHDVNKRTKFASCGKQIHSEDCQNIFVGYLYGAVSIWPT